MRIGYLTVAKAARAVITANKGKDTTQVNKPKQVEPLGDT